MLDNDVDLATMLPWLQGRLGLSVVTLPEHLRSRSDDEVLAEAKRQDRILITHDRRFLQKQRFTPAENPGVIIIPGGDSTDHRGLVGTVLIHVSELRFAYIETVLELAGSGRATLWNHNPTTDQIDRISMRVRWDPIHPVELWYDKDADEFGQAPTDAWDEEIAEVSAD